MDVVIVGAGLGGLCLAQGLRQRGIGVTVLEADPALEARKQGYRLNINVSGASALAACLPDPLVHRYRATSHRQLDPAVTMYTPHFEPVFTRRADTGPGPVAPSAVDRTTLRRILAAGLPGVIRYGMPVTGVQAGGQVVCADGSRWTADLVVAADGVRSVARRILLPGNEPAELGVAAIYGRTLLTPQVRRLLPEPVFTGRLTGLVDGKGLMLALGAWDPWQSPGPGEAQPYLMWAVIGPSGRLGLTGADPAGLHASACSLIATWDSGALDAVRLAQVPETFGVRIRCSAGVPDWPGGRVTFLGDAVHTMTPAGGEGANTAMHDAATLAAGLGLVQEGRLGLQAAIGTYEAELRASGNAAIVRSQRYAARERPRGRTFVLAKSRALRLPGHRRAGEDGITSDTRRKPIP